jgi:hypothetical protein
MLSSLTLSFAVDGASFLLGLAFGSAMIILLALLIKVLRSF